MCLYRYKCFCPTDSVHKLNGSRGVRKTDVHVHILNITAHTVYRIPYTVNIGVVTVSENVCICTPDVKRRVPFYTYTI